MNLARFPRRRYTTGTTPIERLSNLEAKLFSEGPKLFIKRDDLLGLTEGGNKTRKLEYLVADALQKGATSLITCGAIQSNHCRLTLSAAKKEGLKCHLVLEERVANTFKSDAGGNNFLYHLLGADSVTLIQQGETSSEKMQQIASECLFKNEVPYIIPGGGSNEIGAIGYVACALEILEQSRQANIAFDHVVVTSGSSGTHAGLLAGFQSVYSGIKVTGISVSRNKTDQTALVNTTLSATCKRLGVPDIPATQIDVRDDYLGEGYSLPTPGMIQAVKRLAETEGILLDPVYTGKAFDGFCDMLAKQEFDPDQNILFIHTGGSPALYAYEQLFWPSLNHGMITSQ